MLFNVVFFLLIIVLGVVCFHVFQGFPRVSQVFPSDPC